VESEGIYALDKTADEWTQTILKSPYVLSSYRGLKISEFLNSEEPDVDQTVQIGEAIREQSSNSNKYTSLDFEGKLVAVGGHYCPIELLSISVLREVSKMLSIDSGCGPIFLFLLALVERSDHIT